MKIVAGCYERFVWGWDVDLEAASIVQIFSRPAHLGPVKCAAAWGGDCVTGGSDDTIHVYDLRNSRDRDIGSLQAHKAAVTTVQFFSPNSASPKATHLFTGSEDGTVCIWDADSWIHLKTMKAKAAVLDFSVHPSGKLGLSVQRDGSFRMWNLMNARGTFRSKLPRAASLVQFDETGDVYTLACSNIVLVHNAEDGALLHSLKHAEDKPVLCMNFQDRLLYTGGEDCNISAWDFRSGLAQAMIGSHSNRVKGLASLKPGLLASVSSDGFLKVWDTRRTTAPLMEADTKARLTCVISTANIKGVKTVTEDQTREDDEDQVQKRSDPKEKKARKGSDQMHEANVEERIATTKTEETPEVLHRVKNRQSLRVRDKQITKKKRGKLSK